MLLNDLRAVCAAIPDIEQTGPTSWASKTTAPVSYPSDGLSQLSGLEDGSYWFGHRNDVIGTIVRKYPPTGVIFDIGGGNGHVSKGLVDRGFPAIVLEPDASGIVIAKSRGLPTIEAGLDDIELPKATLPAFGMFDVLEHIDGADGVLANLSTALVPGGTAYVSVPALRWLWSSEDVEAGHFRRYTAETLTASLRRAGLEPLYATYFFRALVAPVFALRTMPTLLGFAGKSPTDRSGEHRLPDNFVGRQIARSFKSELDRIDAGHSINFGTSIIAVARKA